MTGAVGGTLDLLLANPLKVCGEVRLRIHQQLMSRAEGIGAARLYDLVLTRSRPGDWTHVGVAVGAVSGGKVPVLAGNTSDALCERRVMTTNLDTVLLP